MLAAALATTKFESRMRERIHLNFIKRLRLGVNDDRRYSCQ